MFRSAIAVAMTVVVAGCGDPLGGLDRIEDVDLTQDESAAAALPTAKEVAREGFFGTDAATPQGETAAVVTVPVPEKKAGLLGLLRRVAPKPAGDAQADAVATAVAQSQAEVTVPDTSTVSDVEPVEIAALPSESDTPPKRKGLFGLAKKPAQEKPRTGPDASDVPYGTVLAHGLIARVCEAKGKSLGQRVEKASAQGFALHDSAPGVSTARTWYITGFKDGCPRQLTAANAQVGSASLYEQLHFGPGGEHLPYAETDAAYERVKRKVCGARKGKACGAKIGKMEKSTFFVSAYASFGSSNRWSEVLIHDGSVLATAVKSNK